jgi:anti-sigma-K factor RskA
LRSRVSTLESELRQATLRASASDGQLAEARRTAFQAQSSVAVLAAPDLARIDLAGQPAAPRASARAYWSRSRGLVFIALNLPAPPPGRTYQLWVLTAQPAPISAGLMKPDADGRVSAIFETPQDLPKPVAVAVTLEPEGGVPAPTGDKYLVGLAN